MKKKALGFMLAATMTVSVFAGCGGNQNEGRQSHSNAGSEPRLQPTPQLTATPDP